MSLSISDVKCVVCVGCNPEKTVVQAQLWFDGNQKIEVKETSAVIHALVKEIQAVNPQIEITNPHFYKKTDDATDYTLKIREIFQKKAVPIPVQDPRPSRPASPDKRDFFGDV